MVTPATFVPFGAVTLGGVDHHRPRGTSFDRLRVERAVLQRGATFADPRLAAAVVDRLTYNAHIIQTGTTSYRLTTSSARKTPNRKETTPT